MFPERNATRIFAKKFNTQINKPHMKKLTIAFQTSNLLDVKNSIEIIDIISTNIISVLPPPFLPSSLHHPHHHHPYHPHHHHQHRPSSSVIEIAQISMVIITIIISVPSPLPSFLAPSFFPPSFLSPSITSAPPLCWCRWRRRCRCRPVAGVNKQNQFLEFLKESKVRCFSKTKEIPGISHLKSGKNPGIFERKVTT